MGTNYYQHVDRCSHCGRSEEKRHIGKLSAGWAFGFRGYRSGVDDIKIKSYKDWLAVLKDGEIFDEYGEPISLAGFKALVERKRECTQNHTTFCRSSSLPHEVSHAARHCWLDADGNSFDDSEFS